MNVRVKNRKFGQRFSFNSNFELVLTLQWIKLWCTYERTKLLIIITKRIFKRAAGLTEKLNVLVTGYNVKAICLFWPSGLNNLCLCIHYFSLLFQSASVQWWLWLRTTTDISSHLWPMRLKCSPTGLLTTMLPWWNKRNFKE